jgi:hypothetical protein
MSFLGSNEFIYKKLQWAGPAKELTDFDVISLFKVIEAQGYHWDIATKKLTRSYPLQMTLETPWVHERQGNSKRCGLDHQICFNLFGIIPPKCLECWKTVVTPNSFEQLMALRDVQKSFGFPCKCGIELRDYTPKHYGGYHYADSLDEGFEMHAVVEKAVKEHVGKDVSVILKRGCTEYEIVKGPSPTWHMNPSEEKTLSLIENYMVDSSGNVAQSEEVQNYVMIKWFLWAHMNGDMTYQKWNGGKPLFPDYVRYDDKDKATIKQELAIAKAAVLDGVKGEDSVNMLNALFKASDKYQVNPNAILDMGHNTRNPLQIEPVLIGDDDELS